MLLINHFKISYNGFNNAVEINRIQIKHTLIKIRIGK